jgi:uncharacterized protein YjbI with pentapeptide repeats
MEWVTTFLGWLFSWFWRRRAPQAVPDAEAPAEGRAAEASVPRGQQHHWLIDEGVAHWNRQRQAQAFRPDFAGYDFCAQARDTRLWGQPADLDGGLRVILAGVDFTGAKLTKAVLAGADLRRAQLEGAALDGADLAGANLEGADLTDCDLRGAVLDGADLSRARLVRANLSGARLSGANLAWADLTQAAGALEGANLFGARRGARVD